MAGNDKQVIYSMVGVGKVYGQRHVLKDIYLSYYYGAKIGVLGLNGAGKSTLLKIMAGVEKDFLGKTVLSKGYTIGYLEQEPQLDPEKTARQVAEEAVQDTVQLLKDFEALNARFAEPMSDDEMNKLLEEQAKMQDQLDAKNAWDLEARLDLALAALNCPPPDQLVKHMSGGEKRRVALCRLLLQEPDILLLDEPTNHLDAETVLWLERHLQEYKGTVIAVTHDRYFLDNVAQWILELDRGQGIPYHGNYSGWLEQKAQRLAQEEKQESKRQKSLKEELAWIRSTPQARHAKSKARIQQYQERLKISLEQRRETNELFIPAGPPLGDLVIEAKNLQKKFGEKVLYRDLSFKLPPGGIVGIIGPNGAGKTTLFKMLTGKEQPDQGSFRIGPTVKLSYVDQERTLDAGKTIFELVAQNSDVISLGGKEVNSRAYIARFNFTGDDYAKRVEQLSGGERNRLHLACMLKEGGNVLLLDEPTNDLDVNTLRALENALLDFPGCAVVISHDRYFLDRIATHILAFEGDGNTTWFEGNFADYEEDKKRRLGEDAGNNARSAYRKLKRD
ncbi:MAG: energy-dependent translational throttle protein EttA [Bacteriovoracaceae bacterium]|nr:energy-dependent translational throttle protein EttA [Bacteriovoracaceae bacterium]